MRFKEIISIHKIRDTYTNKEYDGLVDDELLNIFNDIAYENMILRGVVNDLDNLERSIPLVLGKHFDKDVVDTLVDEIIEQKKLMV